MGMRINTGSGIDPKMVDQLVELEKEPIKKVQARKEVVTSERKLFDEMKGLVSALGGAANGLRNRTDFIKLKLESSHPDILDGTVDNQAPVGTYELEVRSLARKQKLLADAFPDKDQTSVGFGYMTIELDDGTTFDVDVDPDQSTLQDVARQINAMGKGARAIVINTKENLQNKNADSWRLLVISEKSGKEGKVYVDPDTTYLEFKEQVTGHNLELLFEDVSVFDEDNTVEALLPGVVLNVKRAEPGTKINLKIDYDVDKTLAGIKSFVDGYNKINEFIEKQFQIDPNSNRMGPLAHDNSLRNLRRSLQSSLQFTVEGSKYRTLADIGISTDPKTGALKMDDDKAKQALNGDYLGVANLFVQTDESEGVGTRMSNSVRNALNAQTGVLGSKDREYKKMVDNFDAEISRKERFAAQRGESIKRRFSALESVISNLNAQGQAMQQKLQGG